ncbi:9423_t:CDS:2, partial [Cetraspora pellucida]
TIYSSLVSLNNTDEHYEGENKELNMNFNVELSSFADFILEQDESQKENLNSKISQQIISFISEGDAKHPVPNKQRDTPMFLERFNCKGIITIKILSTLNVIKVKYLHKMLHSRPQYTKTTQEIQHFIQNNINCSASKI